MMSNYIVFDFETTGLSPYNGDRAIEIGAVLVSDGEIKDRFQTLMNPGMRISSFIESYTGISNEMLSSAPTNSNAMKKFSKFIGNTPLIAHNASFDKNFLMAEFSKIDYLATQPIACSLKVARRLYQNAPNHKLMTLIKINNIKITGQFHRALADAEMTARLWMKMGDDLKDKFNHIDVNFAFMHKLSSVAKKDIGKFISRLSYDHMPNQNQ